jgi:copper resistance protein B
MRRVAQIRLLVTLLGIAVYALPATAQMQGGMEGMPGMGAPAKKPAPRKAAPAPQTPASATSPASGSVPNGIAGSGSTNATQNLAPGLYPIPGMIQNPAVAPQTGIQLQRGRIRTQPNLAPGVRLPPPVMDFKKYSYTLFDVFEYRPKGNSSDFRWDIEGWRGGDFRRTWFKTEGQRNTSLKADYDIDFQLLTSRLIKPYTELQFGARLEAQKYRQANVARPMAVVTLQSLVPYNYETQTSLFVDPRGNVSARFAATKDTLVTQRLILQSRFESNAAIQQVERFTTGPGLNNLELGFRLRYEIKREFAPYIGISFDRSFGRTASLVRRDGGNTNQTRFVLGVRAWF